MPPLPAVGGRRPLLSPPHYTREYKVHLLWIVDEIREKDTAVRQASDARMKSVIQLQELLARTRLAPVSDSQQQQQQRQE